MGPFDPSVMGSAEIPGNTSLTRLSQWVQLNELLAQDGGGIDSALAERASAMLRRLEQEIPAVYRACASSNAVPASSRPIVETERLMLELLGHFDKPGGAIDASAIADLSDGPDAADACFLFETDPRGMIRWTDAPVRAPLIGLSIAQSAREGAGAAFSGVDAACSRAFGTKAPIRDVRLRIGGESMLAGEWRMSAVPLFAEDQGFQGYRGCCRRLGAAKTREGIAGDGFIGSETFALSMRQLVHELRTPLNAISGFAQILRGQIFGPVPHDYRDEAMSMERDAAMLLAIIDDLELAAKLDGGDVLTGEDRSDLTAALSSAAQSENHAQRIDLIGSNGPIPVMARPDQLERLLNRLIAIVAGSSDGAVLVDLTRNNDTALVAVRSPRVRGGLESRVPANALGTDFSLHLLSRLAAVLGGGLTVEADGCRLSLPIAANER